MQDMHASLTVTVMGTQLFASYHDYKADEKSLTAGPMLGKVIDTVRSGTLV